MSLIKINTGLECPKCQQKTMNCFVVEMSNGSHNQLVYCYFHECSCSNGLVEPILPIGKAYGSTKKCLLCENKKQNKG